MRYRHAQTKRFNEGGKAPVPKPTPEEALKLQEKGLVWVSPSVGYMKKKFNDGGILDFSVSAGNSAGILALLNRKKEEDEEKLLQEYRRIGAQEGFVAGAPPIGRQEYGGAIPTEKRYDHGGVHYDSPEEEPTRGELRKQKREDEEGMIPARFRNRGQEGLDAYRAMMKRRRDRKGLGIMDALRELFQKKKGTTQKEEGHCIGGSCGQFGN